MLPFATLLLSVSLVPFAKSQNSDSKILKKQCWYEQPLRTVEFQSTLDGFANQVINLRPASPPLAKPRAGTKAASGPWTYEPICTTFLESVGSQLCVYSNSSFSNGRGISIFTTPKLAKVFAELPAFQDPVALNGINGFSGAWHTEQLPGRGVGMLAKKELKHGDRITAYTPALVAYLESALSTPEREKYYRIAINQLPERTRDAYLDLATVYGKENIRVQDIVKANTFQLLVGDQNHMAIFPETSRLNHDCGPNAQYYVNPLLLTHFVHATRPIAVGEEITISYTDPLFPTETRQQRLKEGFHFTCSCSRCGNPSATDATLERIHSMRSTLNDWSFEAFSKATPRLAYDLIQLYRGEGLEGFLDMPYGFAALAYNAAGDSKHATKYAEKAKEVIQLKDGGWTPNMQLWNELLADPKKHWSYRARAKEN